MTTKRKPVNYDIASNSTSTLNLDETNQKDSKQEHTPPSLPARGVTTSTKSPVDQPPLPKRHTGKNNLPSHTKQSTNSSVASSNLDWNTSTPLVTCQSTSSLDIPSNTSTISISANNSSHNAFKKRALFFNTPKRLFAGDTVRNTNLAQLETNNIIEEFVQATGLTKNGGLIKDVRKHVRHATRTLDDDASVDSGRSTRDSEAASRIKQVYNELDSLRRKNEVLERILREKNIQIDHLPESNPPSSPLSPTTKQDVKNEDTLKDPIVENDPIVETWREIEDYTMKILQLLGIGDKLSESSLENEKSKMETKDMTPQVQVQDKNENGKAQSKKATESTVLMSAEVKVEEKRKIEQEHSKKGTGLQALISPQADDIKNNNGNEEGSKKAGWKNLITPQVKVKDEIKTEKNQLLKKEDKSIKPPNDVEKDTKKTKNELPIDLVQTQKQEVAKHSRTSKFDMALKETVLSLNESITKKTLSKDDQTKLNQKADSLLSAIKQEQTKMKKKEESLPVHPQILVKNQVDASVTSLPDTLNSLGNSELDIDSLKQSVPIDEHLASFERATSVKSVMDSFEQDLLSIMDDFGF